MGSLDVDAVRQRLALVRGVLLNQQASKQELRHACEEGYNLAKALLGRAEKKLRRGKCNA